MAQAQDGQNNQQQGGGGFMGGFMNRIIMISVLYFMFVGNPFKSAPKDPSTGAPMPPHRNLMPEYYDLDLWVYVSESDAAADFSNPSSLVWHEENIRYDDWADENYRKKSLTLVPTPALLNNGSMYAHIIMARHGTPTTAFTSAKGKPLGLILYKVHPLTKMAVQTIGSNKKNLITGETSDKQAAELPQGVKKIVSHWKGNMTIALIQDRSAYARGTIPPQLEPYYKFDANGNYYPILWCNEFWVLRENLMPLNDTVKELKLDLSFEPLSLLKFSLYTQMDQSFSMQRDMLGAEEAESEEFKHMLIDNPPWLLALTLSISLLHMVFDMLAFKNDIQFWRARKSMEGLSVRTIYFNLACEGIIFLYLLDNQTSWMVLFSAGMALVLESWKITRAVDVTVIRTSAGLPWLKFTDKSTYVSSTKTFDQQAMTYLSYAIFPLVIGYSVYSFMYEEHKSVYSWLVGSLAGAVYTFGFIMMTPQLFINYKLKSVAHLPWRTFVYKALNTFIDDLFAFIIRMPTMHRLRVFRDDIIFLIYLYQRWIYPVDKNRVETPEGEGDAVDPNQPAPPAVTDGGEPKTADDKKND